MFIHKDIGFAPVEKRDLEAIRKLRNDPTTWMQLGDATQITPAMQEAWFERIQQSRDTAYFSVFAIERDEFVPIASVSAEPIGIIRVDQIDTNNRSARVGCDIMPSYRGKGYGTQTFHALMAYWFRQMGFHRLWLCVLEGNEVARKLYANVGFKDEGIMREAVWRDGGYQNYIVMSILADEYREAARR